MVAIAMAEAWAANHVAWLQAIPARTPLTSLACLTDHSSPPGCRRRETKTRVRALIGARGSAMQRWLFGVSHRVSAFVSVIVPHSRVLWPQTDILGSVHAFFF